MKLTGKLKEKVSKAETKEQAKEIIAHAGMELTDDEMNMVSGGEFTPTHHKDLNGDNQVVTYGNPVIFRLEEDEKIDNKWKECRSEISRLWLIYCG